MPKPIFDPLLDQIVFHNHTGELDTRYVALAPTSSTRNIIQPTNAAYIPLIIKGAASQTANLQEWQLSDGTVTGAVQSYGVPYFNKGQSLLNLFLGYQAAQSITTGISNVALGYQALQLNTTGNNNIAVGAYSMTGATGGNDNIAFGSETLQNNTTGTGNVAIGRTTLQKNTTGTRNMAIGTGALTANTTGEFNTAISGNSLRYNTTGSYNSAGGYASLYALSPTSKAITAFADAGGGQLTVTSETHGQSNGTTVRITGTTNYNGSYVISNVTTDTFEITKAFVETETGWWGILTESRYNTGFGSYAGYDTTTGSNNTFLGYSTGRGLKTGSANTILGANVTGLASDLSNNIILADGVGNIRIHANSVGNVGIGTTAPGGILHLRAASDANIKFTDEGSNVMRMSWIDDAASTINAEYYAYRQKFYVNGSERLRLSESGGLSLGNTYVATDPGAGNMIISGNVGIGTTAPAHRLHIAQSGAQTTATYGTYITNTATSSTASIVKAGILVSSTGTWDGTSASNVGVYINTISGGTNNYGIYQVGTAEKNYITSLGIGYPAYTPAKTKLYVYGSMTDAYNDYKYGIISILYSTPSASTSAGHAAFGAYYSTVATGTYNSYSLYGFRNDAHNSSEGTTTNQIAAFSTAGSAIGVGKTATSTTVIAGSFNFYPYLNGTFNVTTLKLLACDGAWNSTATYSGTINITSVYGLNIGPMATSGNATWNITNKYGIYIGDITGGATINSAIVTNAGNIIFNEGGDASTDFRVESDTEANMVYLDANGSTDGELYLGGTTNGVKILKGGSLSFIGTAGITDATNINFGTTTGSKIGNSATAKLALYDATPIVRQNHIVDADGTLADATTKINAILVALENLGVVKTA